MKLGKIERLMLQLALKVQPTELHELVFSCSELSEAQKVEAHTPIKLFVTLKKISGTDERFLEALKKLFEEISHFEELLEIVRAFRRENPRLDRTPSFDAMTPNLPNGAFSFRPEKNQQLRFHKTLLNISGHTDWVHLEIMVALSPIPDGLKESISKGFELFDRLKQHGCISENDTELLDEFFSLLNLQKPMQLLRAYQEQYPQVLFDDPPPTAPLRTVSTPPQSLSQSGFSISSHNSSSMHSQPSYQSQYGEIGRETQVRPTDTRSSLPSSSIYPQPIQPTTLSAPSDIYPRNPVQCTSVPGSVNPATEPAPAPPVDVPHSLASLHPTSKMLDQRKRKNITPEETSTAARYPPQVEDEQPPQAKRTQSHGLRMRSHEFSSSVSSTLSHGHESLWLQSCNVRQQPSLGNEPVVGNQNAIPSVITSNLPTQEGSSEPHSVPATPVPQYDQYVSHELPDIRIHAQESGTEAPGPGERPFPPSSPVVWSKQEAWRAAGKRWQEGEAPLSINVAVSKEQRFPTTSISASYDLHPGHYRGTAESSDQYPTHPCSAQAEYTTAQPVSPNQRDEERARVVCPTYSAQVSVLRRNEDPITYTTNPSYPSASSVESGGSFTSAGTTTLLGSTLSSGGASSGGSQLSSQSSVGTFIGSEYSSSPAHSRQTQPSNRSSIEGYRPSSGEDDENLATSSESVEEEEGGGEEQSGSWIVRTVSGFIRKFTGSGKNDTKDASSDEYESCDEDPSTNH